MSDKSDLLAELVVADVTIREQAEEIERLRKEVAKLQKLTGWQPIETATINRPAIFYHPAETGRPLSEWIRVGYFSDTRNRKPTHWMPLPKPPAVEGES